jgi:linoleoyl-CoA desaturase
MERHLFPNICHIHYRKIAPPVEKTAKDLGCTHHLKPGVAGLFMHMHTA